MPTSRTCVCGSKLSRYAKLCRPCQDKRVSAVKTLACQGCGIEFRRKVRKRNKGLYCSRECAFNVKAVGGWNRGQRKPKPVQPFPLCVVCGKPCSSRKKETCSDVCSQQKREELRRQLSLRTIQRVCKVCGKEFVKPLFRPGLFVLCSEECKGKAKSLALRRLMETHGTKSAERARRRGLKHERCGPIAVCTRDKWRCQLCGVSTPRKLRGTYDLRAPEVDHIIPLAHPDSPGHVWANVQCLCRNCNLKKRAQVLGQLRLAM